MRAGDRLLLAAAALVLMTATGVSPAVADDETGAYVDSGGNPTAEAGKGGGGQGGAPSSSGGTDNCTWEVTNPDDSEVKMYDESGRPQHSETGRWLTKTCDGKPVSTGGSFAIPEQNPEPPDPAVLSQRARQSVSIGSPPIATSPEADRRLYTRVVTWLWLDPAWWRQYSATASAGEVSSTVVATPTRATWTMGDGGKVVCQGPGVEWRPGMTDDQTTCSYVYKNSSAGRPTGTYTLEVTVEFEVSWGSTTGAGGTLAPITRSASRTVEVGEIQAIETQ